MSVVSVVDEWLEWGSSGATLEIDGQQASVSVPGVSLEFRAEMVESVSARVAEGTSLLEAVGLVDDWASSKRVPRGEVCADDVILVDASDTTEASRAVDVVKSVSALARGVRRVVAVAGSLDFTGSSDYDNLSAFGALMVRLNVTQVFAIGPGARALFLSVGMEGSWDGESQHCQDTATAYDDIRARIRPGDVLLVLGSTEQALSPLVGKLREGLA